jgi:hypothetical protein
MVNFAATTAASAPELASRVMRVLPREFQDAFVQAPDVFMFFSSIFLAAVLVAAFWMLTGMGKASTMARMALRGQALKRTKDHRALVLIAEIEGGGSLLRQEMKEAIEDNFGMFSFEQDVQVDLFPIKLKTVSRARILKRVGASLLKLAKRSSVRPRTSSCGASATCLQAKSISGSRRCLATAAPMRCRISNSVGKSADRMKPCSARWRLRWRARRARFCTARKITSPSACSRSSKAR